MMSITPCASAAIASPRVADLISLGEACHRVNFPSTSTPIAILGGSTLIVEILVPSSTVRLVSRSLSNFDAEYVEISFPRSGLVGQSPVKIG
jgi:hypothetical protein